MLYSVELKLTLTGTATTPLTAYHLFSLFLSLIARSNQHLSAELHEDSKSPKPFTLAFFSERVPWLQNMLPATMKTLNVRLTFLREEVFTAIADAVWHLPKEESLPLGDWTVVCKGLATTPAQSCWAAFTTFEELEETAPKEPSVELIFLSPTTFRSGGRRNILLPEPSLVFKSLATRWTAFAPLSLVLDITESDISAVRLSAYRLSTRLLDFGNYQETGFYGTASFHILEGATPDTVHKLQLLASFAFFSGIGAKTTMGMGQVRRREDARSLPDRAGSNATQGRRGIRRYQG
jgi:CRISPR-associated endoribonuclease Cas6